MQYMISKRESLNMTETHVAYSNLRAKLTYYLDEVCASKAPLFVTRQSAPTVVMVAEDEWRGLQETLHLLRSPANAKRLLRSIAEANAGRLVEHELLDAK
jgi:antitoxin YefM